MKRIYLESRLTAIEREDISLYLTDFILLSLDKRPCSIEDIREDIMNAFKIRINSDKIEREITECEPNCSFVSVQNEKLILQRDEAINSYLAALKNKTKKRYERTVGSYKIDRKLINIYLDYLENIRNAY